VSAFLLVADPMRDRRHRDAASARDVAAWLTWLELGAAAPNTIDAYERTLADLLNGYPGHAVTDFTDLELGHLLLQYPPKSRRIRKAHLASFFRWARLTGRIDANPIDLLPTIKRTPQPVIDVFTPAEEAALCALPAPDGQLMRVLFETGIRRTEATHLQARRLDFDAGMVTIKDGKGKKDRVVPVTERLRIAGTDLILLEGLNPTDYLWYDKPGGGWATNVRHSKPIAETSFGRWWDRGLRAAGVTYRKPHTTRHTFATRWRQRGLDLDQLQQLLGHASIATTSDLYVHTKVSEIATRMEQLLAAEAGA
jgi:integrase/recombinase XerD